MIEDTVVNNQRILRFRMKIGDEVWPVSVNTTKTMVKVQDVVYPMKAFLMLAGLPPTQARTAHRVCQALDGELLPAEATAGTLSGNP